MARGFTRAGEIAYVRRGGVPLQVRLDGLVLLVEVRQVGDEVLDDVGVRQRVDLGLCGVLGGNAACAGGFVSSARRNGGDAEGGATEEWHIHRQASVFWPLMFMAQLPQIPSRQLLLKVRVGSSSFLILTSASRTMGPVLFRSRV
jgi:hypothetical protein